MADETPWRENPGHIPEDARGKRVQVKLRNGMICGRTPVSPASPAGWPATGMGACNWSYSVPPHDFDIARYRVL